MPIWDRFRQIALEKGVTISALLDAIDRNMRLERPLPGYARVRSLSSAARIFVFEHLSERLD